MVALLGPEYVELGLAVGVQFVGLSVPIFLLDNHLVNSVLQISLDSLLLRVQLRELVEARGKSLALFLKAFVCFVGFDCGHQFLLEDGTLIFKLAGEQVIVLQDGALDLLNEESIVDEFALIRIVPEWGRFLIKTTC